MNLVIVWLILELHFIKAMHNAFLLISLLEVDKPTKAIMPVTTGTYLIGTKVHNPLSVSGERLPYNNDCFMA
jgi:hypothetical protein